MSTSKPHLDRLDGVLSARERMMEASRSCDKCGEPLDESMRYVKAFIVKYDIPDEWREERGQDYLREIICPDCEEGVRSRESHRKRGTFKAHLAADPDA